MPTLTAPYVEVQQVVTGYMYQLHIAEDSQGRGITRMDIGPYYFEGVPPRVRYPEAVTNELCIPGWEAIHWFTDESGASWLRWQGGILRPEDGEIIYQMTSNYPATNTGAALHVWRVGATSAERYEISAPDYSKLPPRINPRHDVIGQGTTFARGGCSSVLLGIVITAASIAARHWIG